MLEQRAITMVRWIDWMARDDAGQTNQTHISMRKTLALIMHSSNL